MVPLYCTLTANGIALQGNRLAGTGKVELPWKLRQRSIVRSRKLPNFAIDERIVCFTNRPDHVYGKALVFGCRNKLVFRNHLEKGSFCVCVILQIEKKRLTVGIDADSAAENLIFSDVNGKPIASRLTICATRK